MRSPVVDIHEYLDLELIDRMILLQSSGTLIDSINNGSTRTDLYVLGDFYVEVIGIRINCNESIKDVTPFIKGPRLDKYLESIDLSGMLDIRY